MIKLLCATALCLCAASVRADEGYWPQWRGPSGQGHASDSRVPLEWSQTKNLAWKVRLPAGGHSTPVIWGQRLFLTCASANGDERWVVCVDPRDGKILWQELAAKGPVEKTHATSTHASPSCVTDGKHVWAFFGTPGLFCYTVDGKKIWQKKFGIFTSETNWGVAASPLLVDDLIIVNCDNDGPQYLPPGHTAKDAAPAHLVALNSKTGEIVWQTPRDQGRGFSTPVLIKTGERADIVLNGPLGVWAYDPKTGAERWRCERHPEEDNNKFGEPMPLFAEGVMFAAAGRERGYLQAIRLGGADNVTPTHVAWEVRRTGVRDVGSGVLAGDVLIFADGRKAEISAHDVKTGRVLYQHVTRGGAGGRGGKAFYASPLLLNDKVLCLRQDGVAYVLEPGRELKIVRENNLGDGTDFSASPAVADGRLFLRSQTHLYCISARN